MRRSHPSLARRITSAFFLGNAAAMLLVLVTLYPLALIEEDEPIGPELAVLSAQEDLLRGTDGRLVIAPGGTVASLVARHPGLWFSATLPDKERFTFGAMPAGAKLALDRLPRGVREARFRDFGASGPAGETLIMRVETAAGPAIVAGGGIISSSITARDFLLYMSGNDFWWIPLLTALLALGGAVLVTPILLRGLKPTVAAAAEIDPTDVDKRIPEKAVVKELLPLVRAFNNGLDRLAAAFEQRKRFIADVAHELRTPLAVLNMHIDSMPACASKPHLQRTVFRLSHMVGQMLDAERLSLLGRRRETVDLVELARSAAADVAPLAVSQGYEISFHSDQPKATINADPDAVSRALANLLGNAIAHGGGRGTIEVVVKSDYNIQVSDQGPGVPVEARERIFEPFHRERWDRDGCGLGLHLVREVLRAHGGEAPIVDSIEGATFRLEFGNQPSGLTAAKDA